MSRTARVLQLHSLLKANRYGVTTERLLQELGCSRSTLYRDLGYLRDALGAPLVQEGDPAPRWRYVGKDASTFELPGLWLDGEELFTLALALQLRSAHNTAAMGATPFGEAVGMLLSRLQKQIGPDATARLGRVRIRRTQARRHQHPNVLRLTADALLSGRQLAFRYHARSTDQLSERSVSPQRLIHYRDNWYLLAFDPGPAALRSFALDRMQQPRLLNEATVEQPDAEVDAHEAGYGIQSGETTTTATIHFTPDAARWVTDEIWHPQQRTRPLPDGGLELKLPYSNPRELLMDLLRYGAEAEIVAPRALREQMHDMLQGALARYGKR